VPQDVSRMKIRPENRIVLFITGRFRHKITEKKQDMPYI